jgi:hypothetical protein
MSFLPGVVNTVDTLVQYVRSISTTPTIQASTPASQSITTSLVEIPQQTVTANEDVELSVSGPTIEMDINGSIRSVNVIIPDELVYNPQNKSIINIGKPGVFAIGPRHLHIQYFTNTYSYSSDSDDTLTLFIRHNRVNGISNSFGIKGGNMLTLFLASGDQLRLTIASESIADSPLTQVIFRNNYNRLIVSRLSSMDSFVDTYFD